MLSAAVDLADAPAVALILNFKRPPALKKNLALSALANATLAPNDLVNVLDVVALVHAVYAVRALWLVIVAELDANVILSVFSPSTFDCNPPENPIICPAVLAVRPDPVPFT
jgi:hypothetical protein